MSHDKLKIRDFLPPLTKGPIRRQHLVEWCAAENDYYPLHYDEHTAGLMNLPGPPVQGTYRFALIGQMIARWLAGHGTLHSISVSYRGLDLEGDTLTARGVIESHTQLGEGFDQWTLEVWLENQRGERSTSGHAVVLLPRSQASGPAQP